MSPKPTSSRKKKATPGPKPDLLKIKGDWEQAIVRSFKKKKPVNGWPK